MSNIDFDIKCVPLFTGAWCDVGAGPVTVTTGAGITDCTVGNVANPNATYNSVQAAIDAGCFFIRVIDGLVGGQVPGYTESAFTVPPGPPAQPVMIYVDPGVDWTFNLTTLGALPVDVRSANLAIRGSGWASRLVVTQTATFNELMNMDTSTNLFFMDLAVENDTAMSFPAQLPWGLLYARNSRFTATTSVSEVLFSMSTGGLRTEFEGCTFDSTIAGALLFDALVADGQVMNISDCRIEGTWAGVGGVDFLATGGTLNVNGLVLALSSAISILLSGTAVAAEAGRVRVIGMVEQQETGTPFIPPNVNVTNGSFLQDSTTSRCAVGVGAGTGDNCTIQGCLIQGTFTVLGENSKVTGCTILGSSTIGTTTTDNFVFDGNVVNSGVGGITFGALLTGSTISNNTFQNVTFGITASTGNTFSDNTIDAPVTLTGSSLNSLTGNTFTGTVTLSGAFDNVLDGNIFGSTLTLTGAATARNTVSGFTSGAISVEAGANVNTISDGTSSGSILFPAGAGVDNIVSDVHAVNISSAISPPSSQNFNNIELTESVIAVEIGSNNKITNLSAPLAPSVTISGSGNRLEGLSTSTLTFGTGGDGNVLNNLVLTGFSVPVGANNNVISNGICSAGCTVSGDNTSISGCQFGDTVIFTRAAGTMSDSSLSDSTIIAADLIVDVADGASLVRACVFEGINITGAGRLLLATSGLGGALSIRQCNFSDINIGTTGTLGVANALIYNIDESTYSNIECHAGTMELGDPGATIAGPTNSSFSAIRAGTLDLNSGSVNVFSSCTLGAVTVAAPGFGLESSRSHFSACQVTGISGFSVTGGGNARTSLVNCNIAAGTVSLIGDNCRVSDSQVSGAIVITGDNCQCDGNSCASGIFNGASLNIVGNTFTSGVATTIGASVASPDHVFSNNIVSFGTFSGPGPVAGSTGGLYVGNHFVTANPLPIAGPNFDSLWIGNRGVAVGPPPAFGRLFNGPNAVVAQGFASLAAGTALVPQAATTLGGRILVSRETATATGLPGIGFLEVPAAGRILNTSFVINSITPGVFPLAVNVADTSVVSYILMGESVLVDPHSQGNTPL